MIFWRGKNNQRLRSDDTRARLDRFIEQPFQVRKIPSPHLEQEWEFTGNMVALLNLWQLEHRFDKALLVVALLDGNLHERTCRVTSRLRVDERDVRADVTTCAQLFQTLVDGGHRQPDVLAEFGQ